MGEDGPNPTSLAEIEAQASAWAATCGELAAEHFRTDLAVEYKGPNRRDPVTAIDRQVEDFLRGAVLDRFPGHRMLGEERPDLGPSDADFTWVVDPIDGTANFAHGLPIFSVSIGVLHRGVPVVGAIYVTQSPHLCHGVVHARRGGGCFLGEERLAVCAELALHPSHPAALPAAFWRRFAFGRALRRQPIEVRTMGSIAYDLTLIAAGALQFGLYRAPRLWDVAAGVVLVSAAGGVVLNWEASQSRWQPLERFVPPTPARKGEASALRDWAQPIILGGPHVTPFVARHVRPRSGLINRLWPFLRRLLGF